MNNNYTTTKGNTGFSDKLKDYASNKFSSKLKNKCNKIPHYAQLQRYVSSKTILIKNCLKPSNHFNIHKINFAEYENLYF